MTPGFAVTTPEGEIWTCEDVSPAGVAWLRENCAGLFATGDGVWFELEEDAVAFTLAWVAQ